MIMCMIVALGSSFLSSLRGPVHPKWRMNHPHRCGRHPWRWRPVGCRLELCMDCGSGCCRALLHACGHSRLKCNIGCPEVTPEQPIISSTATMKCRCRSHTRLHQPGCSAVDGRPVGPMFIQPSMQMCRSLGRSRSRTARRSASHTEARDHPAASAPLVPKISHPEDRA